MHTKKFIIILLLFSTTIFQLGAQSPNYIVSKTLYNQADGLPHKHITCSVEGNQGFIWLATKLGLSRFDGKKFVNLNTKTHRLYSNNILDLVKFRSQLIITYGQSGSQIYPIQKRQVLDTKTFKITSLLEAFDYLPFKENNIVSVFNTAEGNLGFLVHSPNQIWIFKDNKFELQYQNNPSFKRLSIYKDYLVKVYISGNNCVIKTIDKFYYIQNGDSEMVSFLTEQDHLVYFSPDEVIFRQGKPATGHFLTFSKPSLTPIAKQSLIKGQSTISITESNVRTITPGVRTMFQHHLDGSIWIKSKEKDYLPIFENNNPKEPRNILITSHFVDSRGIFWLCTTEGLVKLNIEYNRFKNEYNNSDPRLTLSTSTRSIYSSTDTLIVLMQDYIIIRIKGKEEIIKHQYNISSVKDDAIFWTGGYKLGQLNLDDLTYRTAISPDVRNEIWSLYKIDKENLLFGTANGLYTYSLPKNQLQRIDNESFPTPKIVYKIVDDGPKNKLIVSSNGIYILNSENQIIDYYGHDAKKKYRRLPFTSLHTIYLDNDGNYWIATESEGLFKWNRQHHTFQQFGIENGFISNTIYSIEEDADKYLWLSTGYGIVRLNKKTYATINYTTDDGLIENEFNRISHFKDKEGRLYFGNLNGLTSFHPKDFAKDTTQTSYPFTITLFSTYYEKKGLRESYHTADLLEKGLTIPADMKFLSITYQLLDYRDNPHQFAYKVEGVDNNWIYTKETSIQISNLPYGKHKLRIKAQTVNGYWNKHEIIIPFLVKKPYYKTIWFISGSILTAILIIIGITVLFFKERIKNLTEMNNLRLKIASDLHDEVGGLLNKTALQSDLARMYADEKTKNLLDKIAENCRTSMSVLSDIMWNLDPRNDTATDLSERIKEFAMVMLSDQYNYSVNISGLENNRLNPEFKQNIYLIIKESINNIVKHSKEGQVEINLNVESEGILITVYNEGSLSTNELSPGQGLKNMEMRAQKYGGTFTIHEVNGGVMVRVKFPKTL